MPPLYGLGRGTMHPLAAITVVMGIALIAFAFGVSSLPLVLLKAWLINGRRSQTDEHELFLCSESVPLAPDMAPSQLRIQPAPS